MRKRNYWFIFKKTRTDLCEKKLTSKEKEWEPTQTEAIAALRFNCLKWGAFPTTLQVFFFPFFFSPSFF